MKKFIVLILTIVILITATSCEKIDNAVRFYKGVRYLMDGSYADEMEEVMTLEDKYVPTEPRAEVSDLKEQKKNLYLTLIYYIENEDVEGLKTLFSPYALTQMENPDKEIQKLIDSFKGELIETSLEQDLSNSQHIQGWTAELWNDDYFSVHTTEGEYEIYMGWWSQNDEEPEKEGLQLIQMRYINSANFIVPLYVSNKNTVGVYCYEDIDLSTTQNKVSKNYMEKILGLIENKDEQGIKNMFTEEDFQKIQFCDFKVESPDIKLERLLNVIKGDLVSVKFIAEGHEKFYWPDASQPSGDIEFNDLESIQQYKDENNIPDLARTYWEINTTEDTYLLYIARYIEPNESEININDIKLCEAGLRQKDYSQVWPLENSSNYDEVGIYASDDSSFKPDTKEHYSKEELFKGWDVEEDKIDITKLLREN